MTPTPGGAPGVRSGHERPDQAPRSGLRALVVEDDPPVSRLIETYLKREGFTVDAANDGEGGLVLARTPRPDLIVLPPDTARHGRRMRPPRILRGS